MLQQIVHVSGAVLLLIINIEIIVEFISDPRISCL
jgi:hypothetical protein